MSEGGRAGEKQRNQEIENERKKERKRKRKKERKRVTKRKQGRNIDKYIKRESGEEE